jgi:protein phosphatase
MTLVLRYSARSDRGLVRQNNQDAVYAGPRLLALADGMGGHAAGEVASRLAVDGFLATWRTGSSFPLPAAVRAATRAANTAVLDAGMEPGRRGMGTTLTAAALNGREATVGHVGDSRAYLVRDSTCTQLTTDHSRVAEMVRMRMITADQASNHPARSQLTRSLGGEPLVQVDLVKQAIQTGDVLVLCTDGLWDVIGRTDLATEAKRLVDGLLATPVELAERLTQLAIKKGTTDNVTAVVIHVTSDRPIAPVPVRRSLFRRSRP